MNKREKKYAESARYIDCPKCGHHSLMTRDTLWADQFNPGAVNITWRCSYCGKLSYEVIPDWRTRGAPLDVPTDLIPAGVIIGQPYSRNPYWRQCTAEDVETLFAMLKTIEVGG